MIERRQPVEWDSEILYTSGDDYFADLLLAIRRAQSSIELEFYIFEAGVLADRMVEALSDACKRGVRTRMIVDGLGSPSFIATYWPTLKAAGVKVKMYRSFPWILQRLPGDSTNFLRRISARLRTVNSGNHRKFCLVDSNELWVGSFNISDVHLREVKGDSAWRDLGVCVHGKELRYARRSFQRAYRGWTALNLPARSPRLLLLNDSFLHKRRARLQQISQLQRAEKRIWLVTPYFVPIGKVYRLLIKRAQQGLDVRLIIPKKNDVWIMKWMSLPWLQRLARKGVKVYIHEPQFLHQKLFIADDWICIGSTNLNHRSFLHDLEMDVVLTHPENKKRLLELFASDQSKSEPLDVSDWAHLPLWKRLLSSLFALVKYWA
jgi:cardiolipin synthase